LARGETNDEALMSAAIDVVVQKAIYSSFAFNLNITPSLFERALEFAVVGRRAKLVSRRLRGAPMGRQEQRE